MFSGGETDRHATARELSPKKGEDLSFAETKIKKVIGIFFFVRNTVQTQILIHVRALIPMNTCTHILPL
jgi:hypothetical protein